MKAKRVAPEAILALKDALTAVYWYKADLRGFLSASLQDPSILAQLDWSLYKYSVVGTLVDSLVRDPARHQLSLLRLMADVARISDFRHLARLEDADTKIRKAEAAVARLRELVLPHEEATHEQRLAEQHRQITYDTLKAGDAFRQRLGELNKDLLAVIGPSDPHQRGYVLERLIRGLFELFDLDPKASFKVVGEQIDGAFTFDNTDYLMEAKWQQEMASTQELDAFGGKIGRKLENTLGLFVSMSGFAASAVQLHSTARPAMILMDGSDLMAVLEGRIDLQQLLLRKRRHAAQTGEIYLPIRDILG